MPKLIDSYGRVHDYLRVSITDRCNLRCNYCMKPEGVKWLDHQNILSYEAILQVIKVAAELGVKRVRLTGGEPLVRPNLEWLVEEIRRIPGLEDLALTTNGILLAEHARALRDAGLNRVNVSLDSLDPLNYRQITRRGDLAPVLKGIEAALQNGLTPLKINVVYLRGVNDHEFSDFLRFARDYAVEVRFIEYMPVGEAELYDPARFATLDAWVELSALQKEGVVTIDASSEQKIAERYVFADGKGAISLIRPISRHFCFSCNRLRLTADGFLKPCLYWQDELDVKPFLHSRDKLRAVFAAAMEVKAKEHQMTATEQKLAEGRSMYRTGG
jgi:cyclic pyranopterin phosphate synthase